DVDQLVLLAGAGIVVHDVEGLGGEPLDRREAQAQLIAQFAGVALERIKGAVHDRSHDTEHAAVVVRRDALLVVAGEVRRITGAAVLAQAGGFFRSPAAVAEETAGLHAQLVGELLGDESLFDKGGVIGRVAGAALAVFDVDLGGYAGRAL